MIITGRNLYGQRRAKYRGWHTILTYIQSHENGETIHVRYEVNGVRYWVARASY